MLALVLVVAFALVFDLTNGFHDSANAVAALIVPPSPRCSSPLPALLPGRC